MRAICQIEGCGLPVKGHGRCNKHYQQFRKQCGHGTKSNICAVCSKEFRANRDQIYCSMSCYNATRTHPIVQRVCEHCGRTYFSRDDRRVRFCSLKCCSTSESTTERLKHMNELRAARVDKKCLHCGKEYNETKSRRSLCCCRACYREYFAARFDRWVGTPGLVLSPQCYDQFLSQEELPCLVEGCEWKGIRLGQHVNMAHGITTEKLREMAGFNRTTGLVTTAESRRMSNAVQGWIDKFPGPTAEQLAAPFPEFVLRPEGREHIEKAKAMRRQPADYYSGSEVANRSTSPV